MSFRFKTIIGISVIEIVLLVILIVSGLNFLQSTNEEQLAQRVSTNSSLFVSATKNAVLTSDIASLESIVKDILMNEEILYIQIYDGDSLLIQGGDQLFLEAPREIDQVKQEITDGVFDAEAFIEESDIVFGRIKFGLSVQSINDLISEAKTWSIGIASLEVFLVALFSWILGSYLTNNLSRLRTATDKIVKSGPGYQLENTGNDEISDVVKSFNTMSLALEKNYDELNKSILAQENTLIQLENSKARTDAVLAASLDGIITIDQESKIIDFNSVAEKIFGFDADDVIGSDLADLMIPEEQREAHKKGLKKYLATGEGPVLGQRIQLDAINSQKQRFPIEIAIHPIETSDGKLFTAYLRDLTTKLEAEKELKMIAEAFETGEAMFITDAKAKIIRVNEAFCHLMGYEESELTGKKPSLWASGIHEKEIFSQMWSALLDVGEWKGELQNLHKDGTLLQQFISISSVKGNDQKIINFIAHVVDIREQNLNEKQLLEVMNFAREADESKSRFLATISHEIRTPMNAVLGVLGLLKDTPVNDEQKELIKLGEESGEMLLSIINDILDFSKMRVGKLTLDSTRFDVHELLQQCIKLLQAQSRQKNINMMILIDDRVPKFAAGDSTRLLQVLVNLIYNAIKFTEEGSITLTARPIMVDDEVFELHCEVIDTGIGIPEEKQGLLFQEFSMIDQSHSRSYEGTGLGLAICKKLVTLMGGEIGVKSELGKGSMFFFHVNLNKTDIKLDEILDVSKPLEMPSEQTKILIAEDNIVNQKIISAVLKKVGLQVDMVNNGKEAVDAVKNLNYDIVLMDISMPIMDGMEATREIRQLEGPKSNTPIVALTAHALQGDKERFLANGMNDYVTKPIDKEILVGVIQQWTNPQELAKLGVNQQVATEESPETIQSEGVSDTNETSNKPGLVDEKVLSQLVRDTSADIVVDLIEGYIEDTHDRIKEIQIAQNQVDSKKLEMEVHTLGSSAGAHGNTALMTQARIIESLCRSGDVDSAMDKTPEFLALADQSLIQLAERAKVGFE